MSSWKAAAEAMIATIESVMTNGRQRPGERTRLVGSLVEHDRAGADGNKGIAGPGDEEGGVALAR